MTYDRFYYSTLDPKKQKVYQLIYHGIEKLEKEITVDKSSCALEEIKKILEYVGLDNPHLFYVDFSRYTYYDTTVAYIFTLTYWYTPDELKELNHKVENVLRKMLKRVTGQNEYEKEKSVHDLIAGNVLYNTAALDNLHVHSPRTNTILGVLFYKTAVCEGIAKVAKMLLNMLDIKCIVVSGRDRKHNVPHAWNIVKIAGEAYHVDFTWDMNGSVGGRICYDYFNLTDQEIQADHVMDMAYPQCRYGTYKIKPREQIKWWI